MTLTLRQKAAIAVAALVGIAVNYSTYAALTNLFGA